MSGQSDQPTDSLLSVRNPPPDMSDEEPDFTDAVPGLNETAQKRVQLAQAALDEHWEDVISDMQATAEEYESRGWEVEWTRPGDVTLTTTDEHGDATGVFVITTPGSGYDAAGEFVDGKYTIEQTEVYRAVTDQAVFLVVALLDESSEAAFLFPIYYSLLEWAPLYEEGTIFTRIRHIDGRYWDIGHDDPTLFAPPESEEPDEEPVEEPTEPEDVEPPEPAERPYEDLSECTPEEIAGLSRAELRAYRPDEFEELNEEQLAALDIPRGGY